MGIRLYLLDFLEEVAGDYVVCRRGSGTWITFYFPNFFSRISFPFHIPQVMHMVMHALTHAHVRVLGRAPLSASLLLLSSRTSG